VGILNPVFFWQRSIGSRASDPGELCQETRKPATGSASPLTSVALFFLILFVFFAAESQANAESNYCGDTKQTGCFETAATEILAPLLNSLSYGMLGSEQVLTSSDDSQHRAGIEFNYLYYRDNSGDVVLRSSSSRTAWVRNVHLIEHKDGVKTFDYQGSQRAESHSIEAIANLTEAIEIDGAIGSILTDPGRSDFIGSIRGDFSLFSGKLSASVSRGMLTWGAETIRNRVMTTDFALYAYRKLIGNLAISANLNHREVSDDNSSNSMQLAPEYGFDVLKNHITVGYRFSYLTFARQTYSGYSAPKGSVSHNGYWDFYHDWGRLYSWLELSGGYGASRMTTTTWGDFYGGGSANIGLRLTKKMLFELNSSGNNSGLSDPTEAWCSFSSGFKVKYTF
jgi:hypothetical protein